MSRGCYYTSYQTLIDWNGNMYLCPQDWDRRLPVGNIMLKEFFDIWNGGVLNKYRRKHLSILEIYLLAISVMQMAKYMEKNMPKYGTIN